MTERATDTALRLGFVGDVSLGRSVRRHMAGSGVKTPLDAAAPVLADLDLRVANLEGAALPYTEGRFGPASPLTATTEDLHLLADAGIDVVTLANNHSMDEGAPGLDACTRALARYGIGHVGAGTNRYEAERPLLVTRNGRRISLIAACDHARHWAGARRPGIAPLGWRRVTRRVREARRRSDLVIVLLHADHEFVDCPTPRRIARSRALVRHGADLVIQHHPHVWQGVEHHPQGLIAYSLGNFVFPVEGNPYQESRPGTAWTHVLEVEVHFRGTHASSLSWHTHPFVIRENHLPTPASTAEAEEILADLRRRSALLADRAAVQAHHLNAARREWRNTRNAFLHALHGRRWKECCTLVRDTLAMPAERDAMITSLTRGRL